MATITLQATTINSAIVAAATALYDDLGGQVAPEPRVIRNGALSGGGRVGSSVNLDYFYDAWKSTDISPGARGAGILLVLRYGRGADDRTAAYDTHPRYGFAYLPTFRCEVAPTELCHDGIRNGTEHFLLYDG